MISYRPDIDGLRAVSIFVVLMFHAGFGDWTGGFIGVDVFFVISGYLITSLIAKWIGEGRFNLLSFYERRVRRLLSAAIPVLVFTTLFAWAFYPSETFAAYSKSLIAFVTYTSNWFFLRETGYFATSPEATPLLHTWSLAVEEQFYLVFPALLLVLARFKGLTKPVLAVLALACLAYSQIELNLGNADRAFFSSVSRFWELLLGALLALSPSMSMARGKGVAFLMRAAGMLMILVPVFLYGPGTPFPGLAALPPVIGALLIIAAGPEPSDPIAWALSAAPAVYLGRISYSLYLWHWPVLGAMHTLSFSPNDLHATIALLISIALAALSYHYVEQPVRTRKRLPRGRDMAALLSATTLAAAAAGIFGWMSGGWPGRFGPEAERIAALAAKRPPDPDKCFDMGGTGLATPNTFCKIGVSPGAGIDLLLWGDSHAGSLIPLLKRYAETRGLSFAVAARGDCVPLFGVWRSKDGANRVCRKFNDEVAAFIRDNSVKAVVIAARWSVYTGGIQWLIDDQHPTSDKQMTKVVFKEALERTLAALEGRRLAIVEQVPQSIAEVPSAYLVLTRLGRPISSVGARRETHEKQMRFTAEALTHLEKKYGYLRIDPAKTLCKAEQCIVETNGKLLYFDDDHLNLEGSMLLYPLFEAELDRWLAGNVSAVPSQGSNGVSGTP